MRFCINCNSNTTYKRKSGYSNWYKTENGFLCQKCYHKLIANPKITPEYRKPYNDTRNPELIKKFNGRRMKFKDKIIFLKENPRKGVCGYCGKKIGDEFVNHKGETDIIKKTDIHHEEYHLDNPLKNSIELCVSCHGKTPKINTGRPKKHA